MIKPSFKIKIINSYGKSETIHFSLNFWCLPSLQENCPFNKKSAHYHNESISQWSDNQIELHLANARWLNATIGKHLNQKHANKTSADGGPLGITKAFDLFDSLTSVSDTFCLLIVFPLFFFNVNLSNLSLTFHLSSRLLQYFWYNCAEYRIFYVWTIPKHLKELESSCRFIFKFNQLVWISRCTISEIHLHAW